MKFIPPLRGALMIFGSVVLLECLYFAGHLVLKGLQEPPWKYPEAMIVPVVLGLIFAVGKGLWHVRRAKQTAPGAVTFDRYGFSIVNRAGVAFRVSWRLLTRAFLEERPEWRWRFVLKDQMEVFVSSDLYTRDQWKDLTEEFTRRLKRRKVEVRVLGAGQLDP
jgi:hypothetical protein